MNRNDLTPPCHPNINNICSQLTGVVFLSLATENYRKPSANRHRLLYTALNKVHFLTHYPLLGRRQRSDTDAVNSEHISASTPPKFTKQGWVTVFRLL